MVPWVRASSLASKQPLIQNYKKSTDIYTVRKIGVRCIELKKHRSFGKYQQKIFFHLTSWNFLHARDDKYLNVNGAGSFIYKKKAKVSSLGPYLQTYFEVQNKLVFLKTVSGPFFILIDQCIETS